MNNPYDYNSMPKDKLDVERIYKACARYDGTECEIVAQSTNGCKEQEGLECDKPYKCFPDKIGSKNLDESKENAMTQCRNNMMPHGGGNQPHGGGNQPHGGNPVGGGGNGGGPSPSSGSKSWWNSPAGIATIIAIALGSAILITVVFYFIRRATMKKRSK